MLAVNKYFQTPHLAKPFIFPPTKPHMSKTCKARPEYKICPGRTLTQLCQIHIRITRCAVRCSTGARGRSHTHCPLQRSPLPLYTPFSSPPLASLPPSRPSWFQRRSERREKAFGSNSLLLEATFAWGRDCVLFMAQHSVAIKALIRTVFWSQLWVTPLFPRFGPLGLVPTEGATGGGRKERGSVGMSLHRRHGGRAPKHGFQLGEKKTQAKKRQSPNYTPAC